MITISKKPVVHMFWYGSSLNQLALMGINSFLYFGYRLKLWVYQEISNAPSKDILHDANEIVPIDKLNLYKQYKNLGLTHFSDYFRCKLLANYGGLYADTDYIVLNGDVSVFDEPFLSREFASEYYNQSMQICGGIVYNPEPRIGNLMDVYANVVENYPLEQVKWGEIGPQMLGKLYKLNLSPHIKVHHPYKFHPIHHADCPKQLLIPNFKLPKESIFCHCYNAAWNNNFMDSYPQDSLMDKFQKKYL